MLCLQYILSQCYGTVRLIDKLYTRMSHQYMGPDAELSQSLSLSTVTHLIWQTLRQIPHILQCQRAHVFTVMYSLITGSLLHCICRCSPTTPQQAFQRPRMPGSHQGGRTTLPQAQSLQATATATNKMLGSKSRAAAMDARGPLLPKLRCDALAAFE